MATQKQLNRHDGVIQDVIDEFDILMDDVTQTLEARLVAEITSKTTADELLDMRPFVEGEFQALFNDSVKEFVPAFDEVAKDTIKQQVENEIADPASQLDNRVVAEMKAQSFNRINESANSIKEEVIGAIVVGAMAGLATKNIAQNVAYLISGVFAKTDDLETSKLQSKLRKAILAKKSPEEIQAFMTQLKKRMPNVPVSASLVHVSKAEMRDMVMDFDGVFTRHRAKQAGLKKFKYSGTLIAESRDFCIHNQDRIFTEAEARRVWASQTWQGKRPGDPFVVRGGYNCRHFWVPVK